MGTWEERQHSDKDFELHSRFLQHIAKANHPGTTDKLTSLVSFIHLAYPAVRSDVKRYIRDALKGSASKVATHLLAHRYCDKALVDILVTLAEDLSKSFQLASATETSLATLISLISSSKYQQWNEIREVIVQELEWKGWY